MTLVAIDPLVDPRWGPFVRRHPRSSPFHTTAWLSALTETYGYRPVAFTTAPQSAPIDQAVVFCDIRSWLTGRRLVSLPFSDHCDPLVDGHAETSELLANLHRQWPTQGWRYLEIRERAAPEQRISGMAIAGCSWNHTIDLRWGPDYVFGRFHRDCVQRKIRRAEREGVDSVEGHDEALVGEFFRLIVETRRRHGVPPQPVAWFRAVLSHFGDAATLRIARFRGRAIAGMLTLRHRDQLLYKYGASQADSHHLGAMPLLFWRAVQDGCRWGAAHFDLGRCEMQHHGLARFKERLGAERKPILVHRSAAAIRHRGADNAGPAGWSQGLLARLPAWAVVAAGRALYKHAG